MRELAFASWIYKWIFKFKTELRLQARSSFISINFGLRYKNRENRISLGWIAELIQFFCSLFPIIRLVARNTNHPRASAKGNKTENSITIKAMRWHNDKIKIHLSGWKTFKCRAEKQRQRARERMSFRVKQCNYSYLVTLSILRVPYFDGQIVRQRYFFLRISNAWNRENMKQTTTKKHTHTHQTQKNPDFKQK